MRVLAWLSSSPRVSRRNAASLALISSASGFRPIPARPRASHPALHPRVFGVEPATRSPRVLRDQFLLDELVELVQVDIAQDRGHRAALGNSAERVTIVPVFEVPGFQHVPYQPEKPVVVNFL